MSQPTLFPPSRDIEEVIDVAGRQYNERKAQVPQVPQSQNTLLNFIVLLFDALHLMVITIATNLSRRISAVEEAQEEHEEEDAKSSATSVAPPSTTPQQSTQSTWPKRCQKCHARGHNVGVCRTANPAAMRRRVASNSRLAKEARTNRAAPTIPAQAPSYIPFQSPFLSPPATPVPVNFANLVADATELRQRAAQSSRDRRMNRRRQPSSTS